MLFRSVSQSRYSVLCGTVTFEREDPFSLNDVAISWFDGTTPPVSFGFDGDDTEVEKKQKFMDAVADNTADILALETAVNNINIDGYIDISSSITVDPSLNANVVLAREYNDGTIAIEVAGAPLAPITAPVNIITGLPEGFGAFKVEAFNPDTVTTKFCSFSGVFNKVVLEENASVGLFHISFMYKKQ